MDNFTICGISVIASEAVSPDEVVMLGSGNAARWTPDGGVEEMSKYQEACIREDVERG